MYKKVKKFELRRHICEVIATERIKHKSPHIVQEL